MFSRLEIKVLLSVNRALVSLERRARAYPRPPSADDNTLVRTRAYNEDGTGLDVINGEGEGNPYRYRNYLQFCKKNIHTSSTQKFASKLSSVKKLSGIQ